MARARKKKAPVTSTASARSSSNPHTTRTLIRRFHVLLKKERQLQNSASNATDAKELLDVKHEIERLGGLATYQRMSSIGQGRDRGGGSEKVLIKWLVDMSLSKREDKLSLLEVGALNPDNYASCSSWMTTTPIDLLSRHPSIIEQDFLAMDVAEHTGRWDVISLSLVVNFVPDPKERGRMLVMAHTFLRPSGLLFLAASGRLDAQYLRELSTDVQLPAPCVTNSRYMSFERLAVLMGAIGFTEEALRCREGGRMAYWLYRKTEGRAGASASAAGRRRVCRGGRRNNFSVVLPSDVGGGGGVGCLS